VNSPTPPTIDRLRASHRTSPLGIPARPTLLSWSVSGATPLNPDRGFDITVADSADAARQGGDGAWTATGLPLPRVVFDGSSLPSRARRYWTVSATTATGERIKSEAAWFEIGLLDESDWTAGWIAAPLRSLRRENWDPVPLFRTTFMLDSPVEHARVYATALGVYRLWVNGTEVTSDALLRPGWTDYNTRVYHQTFDVGALLAAGENVVGVELAKGWYAGRIGLQREIELYGAQPGMRLQLEAGSGPAAVRVASGTDWRYSYGPIQSADLLSGETQDIRLEQKGWIAPGFDDTGWNAAETCPVTTQIDPQPHDHVRIHAEHEGKLVWEHGRGPAIFDFGQNLVGWTRVETTTLPKADVIVQHGEILTPHHRVYRDNLRIAFQEDRYTTGDSAGHVLESRFTLHGFRYAEVWGLPSANPFGNYKALPTTKVTAVSVDAGQETVGTFECSDDRLNALASAIEWTVRDNFIEVITDCPQREERLGWLGDAGVISPTAAYHFDIGAFVSKFVQDAQDAQGESGTIRNYAPAVPPGRGSDGAPGWADGYVRLVHLLAARYGDLAAARRHYESLRRYLDYVDASNPSGIRTEAVGADFGDWLSLPEDPNEPSHPGYEWTGSRSTSHLPAIDTAHTYRSYIQLSELAGWLDEPDEAQRCRTRAEEIRLAYRAAFLDADGRLTGDTQTVYAQAIGYGLLDGAERDAAIARLSEKVAKQGHVTTGIHGVEHILPVLARNGHADLAYRMLLKDDMPSWLHMVRMGGTTVWEKWDGLAEDGTLSTSEMNSFNHCALGAVGQFLFEDVAGIDASTTAWDRVVRVHPSYDRALEWAKGSYRSSAGLVASSWRWESGNVVQELDVPPTLEAQVNLPVGFAHSDLTDGDIRLGPGHHTLTFTRA
jgi:alpha-L-rhamnosidase